MGLGVTVKENNIAYVNKNTVNILNLIDGKKSRLINSKEGILLDKEYKYEGNYQEIDSVFFSPDTKNMLTVVFDRTYVWDGSTGQFINMIAQIKEKRQFDLVSVYSASDHLLLIGSQGNNYIRIFNIDDGSVLPSIKAWDTGSLLYGYDGTHSLTISPDGKYVFSWSGLEGMASLWEVKTQKRIMAIKIYGSEYHNYKPGFYPVTISPDNQKLLFTYSSNPDSRLGVAYSIPDGKELYRIPEYYAVFSPDGSIIAASIGNNRTRFYDSETGKQLGDVTSKYPNQDGFQLLYFSDDGKTLSAVSTNGIIGVWGIP